MSTPADRFLEYSGDECVAAGISLTNPVSLKVLERLQSILMYERGAGGDTEDVVRVGTLKDIRTQGDRISFRFREHGQLTQKFVLGHSARLQFGRLEDTRTHWAVKDGEIPQDIVRGMKATQTYDVVLSFAGEQREYVEAVAAQLTKKDIDVFYDRNEEAALWGKNMAEHFQRVYRDLGRYCVMFVSKAYVDKVWTTHERRSALERALAEREEYILPVRFDSTEVPGLSGHVNYKEAARYTPEALSGLILQKLGRA